MAAMPVLNREPEPVEAVGVLLLLAIVLLTALLRFFPFFRHNVLGLR